MKKIILINILSLSFFASNAFALGSVAEAQIEKRLASNQIEYKDTGTFKGNINKRTSLGETIPLKIKPRERQTIKISYSLPNTYNAVRNKRSMLGESF